MLSGEHHDESFEGTLGGAMDLQSTQAFIIDTKRRLQAMLKSLANTDAPLLEAPVPEDSPISHTTVYVAITGDIVSLRQTDLDGLGDFANTRQTPNVWNLAFPTLFPPILNDGICTYFGQPSSNRANRDRSVKNYPAW
jgi:hypothetical protein